MRSQLIISILFVAAMANASALAEVTTGFAVPVSVSLGAGSLKNPTLGLTSRGMSAASLEVQPSYRIGDWAFGPHVDYRQQGQITRLNSAGGSNLKGSALLFGVGFRTQVTRRFFVQQSVDFAGQYELLRNTGDAKVGKFTKPLGARVKAGYAFLGNFPDLSFDIDLQYLTFQKVELARASRDATAQAMIASVGLTYYFGSRQAPPPPEVCAAAPVVLAAPVRPAPAPVTPTATPVAPTEPPAPAAEPPAPPASAPPEAQLQQLDLKSGPFNVGSRYLGTVYKAKIVAAAALLRDKPNVIVKIEGHVDEAEASYSELALERANAVKAAFVAAGIEAARVKTEAIPARQPASPTLTEVDRQSNRRVEILLETEGTK